MKTTSIWVPQRAAADQLGVSERTLLRRRARFGLLINQQSGGHGVSPIDLSTKPGEAHSSQHEDERLIEAQPRPTSITLTPKHTVKSLTRQRCSTIKIAFL